MAPNNQGPKSPNLAQLSNQTAHIVFSKMVQMFADVLPNQRGGFGNSGMSMAPTRTVTSSPDLVSPTDFTILVNAGVATENLPAASDGGRMLFIVNKGTSVSITPNGSDTIGGASSLSLSIANEYALLISDSTSNWMVVSMGVGSSAPVYGPASSTNNDIALFSGTTGELIKDSGVPMQPSSTGDSIYIGFQAGQSSSSAAHNTFLGYGAGANNTDVASTLMGYLAGNTMSTGLKLTAIGFQAGTYFDAGQHQTLIGYEAGMGASTQHNTGMQNVYVGTKSGWSNSTGSHNVGVGYQAVGAKDTSVLTALTGSDNVGVGLNSLGALTSGNDNIGIGSWALFGYTTGNDNVAVGFQSQSGATVNTSTGSANVSMGTNSLYPIQTGSNNVAIGFDAGFAIVSGNNNVFIGYQSGLATTASDNVFIGYAAGSTNITGTKNVYIGEQAGATSTGSSNVFIGFNAGWFETGSNKLYIANTNTTTPLIQGDFLAPSLTFNTALSMASHQINNVTDPTSVQDAATKNYVDMSLSTGKILILAYQLASGTVGGSYSSINAYNKYPLNTIVQNDIGISAISSNQFTLPSGTYLLIDSFFQLNNGNHTKVKLRNTTDSSDTLTGYSGNQVPNGGGFTKLCPGKFAIGASKTFEIDYWSSNTANNTDLGGAASTGDTETYGYLTLLKVA